jgi:putative copper export protein
MYLSLIVFAVTGTYLTIADPNYLGIGNFGNIWGILMLVKHILIVGMIVIGFWYNAILRVGPLMSSNTGADQALARFGLYSKLMAVSGVLVLLLTALAQME